SICSSSDLASPSSVTSSANGSAARFELGEARICVSLGYVESLAGHFTVSDLFLMHRFSIGVALLVSAWSARPLAAQAAGAQTMPIPIIGLGGGISIPAGGIAKDRQPGFNLDALAEFRTPSEPLGLRG